MRLYFKQNLLVDMEVVIREVDHLHEKYTQHGIQHGMLVAADMYRININTLEKKLNDKGKELQVEYI